MNIQLGVIMDPITAIHVEKDSTFAMLLEAQRRKWSIFYMEQKDLILKQGNVWARMHELRVQDDKSHWYEFGKEKIQEVGKLDVVLMRKDPPVNTEYLYATQLLDLVEKAGALVVNKPQSLRDFNEKLFISWFPDCCPPTLVTTNANNLHEFLAKHEDIICKTLNLMAGQMVFRLQKSDPNINVIIETLSSYGTKFVMAQRYLPEIAQGDKRILLIDGEPVPYALARIAKKGETRANLAAGGHGTGVALSERDRWLCEQIAPVLREKGLLFVGMDVIGDYITEINITSPTCIRELDKQYGINISAQLLDCITHKLGQYHRPHEREK